MFEFLKRWWNGLTDYGKEQVLVGMVIAVALSLMYLVRYLVLAAIFWDLGWFVDAGALGRTSFLVGTPLIGIVMNMILGDYT